jgi:hypothetical protein
MRVSKLLTLVSLLCLTGLLLIGPMWGQGLTGTIAGVVTDPNGGVVPAAKVTAKNVGTNATTQTQTDEQGYYRFTNLVPGNYSIIVEASGFRKAELPPQLLTVAAALKADVPLEVGAVSETVTVDATPTQVNTEDAQMGRSLTEIPTLPNISGAAGRNPLNLMSLQPGVVSTSGGPSTTVGAFSVNGQRAQANNYLLDGTDSNDLAINVPDSVGQIAPNALAEFRVVTGAMKAEYGRNSGAVVEVVTRSGTNQFHGSAEDVFRNTVLNATPFFQKVTPGGTADYLPNGSKRKPQWNTNDYDAQFGGPIRRDKTFFFVSYLGFKRRQAQVTSATVFTDAQRALIQANGVPAAVAAMNLVPRASSGNTYFGALGNKLDRDQGLVKIDHRVTDSNTLSGTYFIESQRSFAPLAFGGSLLPGFGTLDLTRFQNVILRDTHTFTPTLMNDFRASYHRRGSPAVTPVNTTSPAQLGFKGIIPDDAAAAGPPFFDLASGINWGNTYQGPQARYDNTYQYADTLSWIKGRHALKFGVDFKTYQQNQLFDFINNGYIGFDGSGTENGLVSKVIPGLPSDMNDFANGYSSDFEQSNSGRQGYRDKFFHVFAQDDWKIRRNVTLNLGLRWEYDAPLTELNNQIVAFRPGQVTTQYKQAPIPGVDHPVTPPVGMLYYGDPGITRSSYQRDLNNFAPRIGMAWDVRGNGKLVVRTGYGIFYDAPVSELSLQFLGNPPLGLQTFLNGTMDMTDPYPNALNPIPQPFPFHPVAKGGVFDYTSVAPVGFTIMDPYFRTPYSMQWNFQVQYAVASDWLVDAAYVGSRGIKLLNRMQLNPGIITPTATSTNLNQRRVYNLALPQQSADYGGAVYSGITDQLTNGNSIYNSLQVALTKRLSHGLQMTHSYTWAHGIDDTSSLRVNGVGNIYNSRLDRANSDTDIRHRYVGQLIYDLPFFKDGQGLMRQTVGGWQVSAVVSAQTGIPFNISDSADRSLTGTVGGVRPDYVGGTVVFADPRQNMFGKQNSYFDGTGGGTATAATNPYFHRVGSGLSVAQGAGRFGTLGRNVFYGPGLVNFDVGLSKTFAITERHKVAFRADAFNLFNHTNFLNPVGNIASATFGRVTSARDPRLVQLTLQYSF